MKNRPLLCVCLLLLSIISICVTGGGEKLIKELRPSPVEIYAEDEDRLTVQGTIYRQEQKDTYQKIYLKDNSIDLNQTKFNSKNINSKKTLKEKKIIIYLKSKQQFKIGNQIKTEGEVQLFDQARNPGNFDQKFYYQKQGIHAGVWADRAILADHTTDPVKEGLDKLRRRWKQILVQELGTKKGTILAAVLIGEKGGMEQEIKELYQANGIGHILAISGLHLSFIGLGVYRMLRRATGSYWIGGISGGLLLILYVVMIGMTISVIRAWVMFLFRVGADIAGRHYDMPTALSVAALLSVGSNPLYILDGGFWLSFGAVFAICVMTWLMKDRLKNPLWVSAGMNSILWPGILYCFYEIPVYSVLLNLAVIPLMSLLLGMGMAGSICCMVSPVPGRLLLMICKWILEIYESGCRYALKLPGARWIIGQPKITQILCYYLFLGITVWFLYHIIQKKEKKWIPMALSMYLFGTGILLYGHRLQKGLEITMLDVGQGDCICVEAMDGSNYLIDGGSSDVKQVGKYRIEPFLKAKGIGTLDYVFVSHGDQDHINGLEELLKRQQIGVRIKNMIFPDKESWDESLRKLAEKAREHGTDVWTIEEGKKLEKNGVAFTCLGPEKKGAAALPEGNASSMILHLSYGSFDMLFTGDVEKEGEEALTQKIDREIELQNISWEVLKVAHHGSKNSTTESFLEAVNPQYAWISAGRKNRYGHPHKETLKRLNTYGGKVLNTQDAGAIHILVREKTMRISRRNG